MASISIRPVVQSFSSVRTCLVIINFDPRLGIRRLGVRRMALFLNRYLPALQLGRRMVGSRLRLWLLRCRLRLCCWDDVRVTARRESGKLVRCKCQTTLQLEARKFRNLPPRMERRINRRAKHPAPADSSNILATSAGLARLVDDIQTTTI